MFPFNLFNIINISGAVIGFFLAFVIIGSKRTDKNVKIILSALLILLSTIIIFSLDKNSESRSIASLLFNSHSTVVFAIGPLVLLYIKALINSGFIIDKKQLLHFIPFILNIFYKLIEILIIKEYDPDSVFMSGFYLETLPIWISFLRLLHLFTYLTYAFILLEKHKSIILNSHSALEKLKLGWLRFVIFAFYTIIINDIICSFLYTYISSITAHYNSFYNSWLSIVLISLGYKGLIQPDISSGDENNNRDQKYKKSNLTKEQSDEYLRTLLTYMENEKPFMESNLTIKVLADQLKIPSRHLSQIINEHLEQNFFDFVNKFRVEEAKKLLLSSENSNYTILALAYDAGFNSKSTFNTVFKKHTNMSPSQYIRTKKN